MSTTNFEFQDFLKQAKEFLPTKERINHYDFRVYDDQWDREMVYTNAIDDEEYAALCALKAKFGNDFVKHIDEVFENPDVIYDLTCGNELLDIDIDQVKHLYQFHAREIKPDGTVVDNTCHIELSDDDYARLLAWHLYDQYLTVNTLRHYDRRLYDTILAEVDYYFLDPDCDFITIENPYVVTFDEARTDADTIRRQRNIPLTGGHRMLGLM